MFSGSKFERQIDTFLSQRQTEIHTLGWVQFAFQGLWGPQIEDKAFFFSSFVADKLTMMMMMLQNKRQMGIKQLISLLQSREHNNVTSCRKKNPTSHYWFQIHKQQKGKRPKILWNFHLPLIYMVYLQVTVWWSKPQTHAPSLTLSLSTSDELLLTGLTFRKHLKLVKFTLPKQ